MEVRYSRSLEGIAGLEPTASKPEGPLLYLLSYIPVL